MMLKVPQYSHTMTQPISHIILKLLEARWVEIRQWRHPNPKGFRTTLYLFNLGLVLWCFGMHGSCKVMVLVSLHMQSNRVSEFSLEPYITLFEIQQLWDPHFLFLGTASLAFHVVGSRQSSHYMYNPCSNLNISSVSILSLVCTGVVNYITI